MEERRRTFCKQERLCSKKLIDDLFRTGHRLMVFPYSVRWKECTKETLPENVPAQVLIATSKRFFRHAVDRNRVKRLSRECYRQHKARLYQTLEEGDTSLLLSINYVGNKIFDYHTLDSKISKVVDQLIKLLDKQQEGGWQ